MRLRVFLMSIMLLVVIGCDGPAENAGENLDDRVAAARGEVELLKDQINQHKILLENVRKELSQKKGELEIAQQELEAVKQIRQDILDEMEKHQKENAAVAVPKEQQDLEN